MCVNNSSDRKSHTNILQKHASKDIYICLCLVPQISVYMYLYSDINLQI